MKKLLTNTTKSAYKWIIFWTFFWLTVFSVAYAASITSTTDPTVSSWDSITASWYQDVNDKLWGISVSGGNVGIGTSSPSNKLHISWWTLAIWELSSNNNNVWKLYTYSNNNDNLEFNYNWVGNAEVVFKSDWKVWIWTTNPGAKLHVNWTTYLWHKAKDITNTIVDSTVIGDGAYVINDTSPIIGFANSSDSSRKTRLRYYIWDRLDYEKAWWGTLFTIKDTGNVWIWTTAPENMLELNGIAPTIKFSDTDHTNHSSLIQGNTSDGGVIIDADRNNSVAGSTYKVRIDGSEKMHINSSGYVWIWTTSPTEKLDVSWVMRSTTHIQSWANSWWVALTVNDWYWNANVTWNHKNWTPEQNGNAARIEVNTDGASDATMDFELGSGVTNGTAVNLTNVMTLKATGNVWIWTTTPQTRFHVKKSAWNSDWVALIEQTIATNYPSLVVKQSWGWGNSYVKQWLVIDIAWQNGWYGKSLAVITNNSNLFNWSTKEVFTVLNWGRVWIKEPNPSVELDVIWSIEYTGTIADVSDGRLKENVEDIDWSLEKIEKIRAVSFEMKDDAENKTEFWVIAQELEKIYPELVNTADDEMWTKSVNYVGLIGPMLEAMKELSEQNKEQKNQIVELNKKIEALMK